MISSHQHIIAYIKSQGLRVTRHIDMVIQIFLKHQQPIEIKYIYQYLRDSGITINLSTIHRIIERLQNIQVLEPLYQSKVTAYELASQFSVHHHHFTCTQCHTIIDIHDCMVNIDKLKDIGFVTSHTFEVRGVCAQCLSQT